MLLQRIAVPAFTAEKSTVGTESGFTGHDLTAVGTGEFQLGAALAAEFIVLGIFRATIKTGSGLPFLSSQPGTTVDTEAIIKRVFGTALCAEKVFRHTFISKVAE